MSKDVVTENGLMAKRADGRPWLVFIYTAEAPHKEKARIIFEATNREGKPFITDWSSYEMYLQGKDGIDHYLHSVPNCDVKTALAIYSMWEKNGCLFAYKVSSSKEEREGTYRYLITTQEGEALGSVNNYAQSTTGYKVVKRIICEKESVKEEILWSLSMPCEMGAIQLWNTKPAEEKGEGK